MSQLNNIYTNEKGGYKYSMHINSYEALLHNCHTQKLNWQHRPYFAVMRSKSSMYTTQPWFRVTPYKPKIIGNNS